jgi:hypothetical protein
MLCHSLEVEWLFEACMRCKCPSCLLMSPPKAIGSDVQCFGHAKLMNNGRVKALSPSTPIDLGCDIRGQVMQMLKDSLTSNTTNTAPIHTNESERICGYSRLWYGLALLFSSQLASWCQRSLIHCKGVETYSNFD